MPVDGMGADRDDGTVSVVDEADDLEARLFQERPEALLDGGNLIAHGDVLARAGDVRFDGLDHLRLHLGDEPLAEGARLARVKLANLLLGGLVVGDGFVVLLDLHVSVAEGDVPLRFAVALGNGFEHAQGGFVDIGGFALGTPGDGGAREEPA